MGYIALFLKLLPTILGLIPYVEKLFADKPKSGAEKKAFVMGVTEQLANAA